MPKPDIWPGMTAARFDQIGQYLRSTADLLELRDWTIKLSTDPSTEDENMAEVKVCFGRKLANVTLAKEFSTMTLEDQQHALIHELIHVHLDQTFSLLNESLPSLIGQAAWVVLQEAQREREEHAVDALASAFAPLVPALPKPA